MKIGIDIRAIGRQRTGDETYTRELVKNLLQVDKENQYFLYTNTDNQEEIAKIKKKLAEKKSLRAEIVPVLPASKALWTFWSLPNHLRKNPVDVLHVQYITPQILPKQIKLVTTFHDVSFKVLPGQIKRSDLLFLNTLIPLSIKKADRIISVSQFTKNEIIKYYQPPEEKVFTVYNGVAENFFEPVGIAKQERIREKYSLPKKFILYLGTLQPRKNIPFLLKSFKKFKEKYQQEELIKDIHLVLVGKRGSHNYDEQIEKTLENLEIGGRAWQESIHFPGFVADEDLPALYQQARGFVFPSLYEGFGLPLIEAMASEIPVLASDSSCHREIVQDAALIYQSDDQRDFIEKLFKIMTDKPLREELVFQGERRAQEFSWQRCAQETLEIYQALQR